MIRWSLSHIQYRESAFITSSDDQRSSFSTSTTSITRPATPAVEDDRSSISASTRPQTPIIEDVASTTRRDILSDNNERIQSIQSILVKQGKQIRALYELQKTNMEKVDMVYSHLKKLTREKSNELSAKVFAVSNFISNSIILR
jgi:hypothetical protein